MAQKKIQYVLPIEHVSRKFTQVANTCGTKNKMTGGLPSVWMGGAVLQKATKEFYPGTKRNSFVVRTRVRTSAVTPNEVEARNRFVAVRAMVEARKTNLSTLTRDQENFVAQYNSANGVRSFNAYLWIVCGAEYDAEHPKG